MRTLFKTTALGLGLVAGIAATAQAQDAAYATVPGQSIANVPMPGPRPSSLGHISQEPHAPVVQTGNYPGPNAGAVNGPVPPHFDKPTDWDRNAAMHPYTSGEGPKAH